MPWSVDDPPPPARNWTEAERRRCVEAANAALEDGKTDEEAIYACIHAAGKGDKMRGRPQEHKSFPAYAVKVDADQGVVEAVVAVIGNVDMGLDRIDPGAFTKTLVERGGKIRVLDQHNTDSIMRVLGKPLEMREVGRDELPADLLASHPEATGGLWTRTQFLMDTPEGRGAFERIKAGAVDEFSIGFDAISTAYEKTTQNGRPTTLRVLKEIRLWEYSPVLWGLNPATATISAKATGGDAMPDEKTPPAEAKEMTPDGPVKRMGDVLCGTLYAVADSLLNGWLTGGQVDGDEHAACRRMVDGVVGQMRGGFPGDMADRPLPSYAFDDFFFWALSPALQTKAGRRLSGASRQSIQAAIDALTGLLADADEAEMPRDDDMPDDEMPHDDDEPKDKTKTETDGKAGKAGPGATPSATGGPGATPPTSKVSGTDHSRILALIDVEIGELDTLEVA